jgi:hypothetical protein
LEENNMWMLSPRDGVSWRSLDDLLIRLMTEFEVVEHDAEHGREYVARQIRFLQGVRDRSISAGLDAPSLINALERLEDLKNQAVMILVADSLDAELGTTFCWMPASHLSFASNAEEESLARRCAAALKYKIELQT